MRVPFLYDPEHSYTVISKKSLSTLSVKKNRWKMAKFCAWWPNFNRIKILTGFDLIPTNIFNRFLFTPIKYLNFF